MHSLRAPHCSSCSINVLKHNNGSAKRCLLIRTGFRSNTDGDSRTAVLTRPLTSTPTQTQTPTQTSSMVAAPKTAKVVVSPGIKVPKTIQEVDNGHTVGFGADLADDHPGFLDAEYKARRIMIADIARNYKVGTPIPRVEYTPAEIATWGTALSKLKAMYPQYACKEFNTAMSKLSFREDEVPQLQDISESLKAATGWQVRPTAGLMYPRDFLAGFAFRYFHSTQYMRHASKPMYTPEPDVIHELLGHVAMLADPTFADLVHSIGLASLGADDKTIRHLTKVFWYTVEFGVVREGDAAKACGAAILSSYGELEHLAKGEAELSPFDPFVPQPKMIHKGGYQPRYFVMDSFEAGLKQLRDYIATLNTHN